MHYITQWKVQGYNQQLKKTFTFACRWSSLCETNSAVPFPALATPFMRAVDTPEPIPKVKHLKELEKE